MELAFEIIFGIIFFVIINVIIYDKYIQRKHQLLINYPLIGRMRYFFEALREPFRQYFGDETFYESKDKVDWVYKAANDLAGYASFSPTQPQDNPKFLMKHSNSPLNDNEINQDFSVIFGENRERPFVAKTIIARSAMSDGAISPEGTRAFTKAAFDGQFPINTGEGSLTTNFFFTHKNHNDTYMDRIKIEGFNKKVFNIIKCLFNSYVATQYFRKKLLDPKESETYIFDKKQYLFFRPNWNAPLESFPKEVPDDMPDIIFQMSSGLYGVRDNDGNFNEDRYQKTMAFCKMTEIKLAQGAKQTGGKLAAQKVSEAIAYYRNIPVNKAVISPNRFPYAHNPIELFDFVAKLQKLSKKPVGIKIVISSREGFEELAKEIKRRDEDNIAGIPDFISIDGGDGGSATAPLFLMDRVGFHVNDAVHIADNVLKEFGIRNKIKIIAASKILTPDDIAVVMALGADFIYLARGFMMSAGCIRARMCSGSGSHQCPVGLATQDKKLRSSYLVEKHSKKVANYHKNLLAGVKTILAVMGLKDVKDLKKEHLTFIDKNGFIYTNINRYLDKKLNY
ncbi:MAG: FMN-binding glutamate synthase family protein [Arcobacter sp.]|nr:MAG: FMN-binding glutamate synthase family protein [Arcobacter sp.]